MAPVADPERRQQWLNELEQKLAGCIRDSKLDVVVDYRAVSQSFPGGPHPDHFDVPLIEWNELAPWARERGWLVCPAPEMTHPDQQSTPFVRFTHQSHDPERA